MQYDYDLAVHYGGSIAFERHLGNEKNFVNCYISVERKFLGKILVVDVEDETAGRYLLGFENGQVAYVKRAMRTLLHQATHRNIGVRQRSRQNCRAIAGSTPSRAIS